MPFVQLDTARGKSKHFLKTLINVTLSTLQENLLLPENDRKFVLYEHEEEFFSLNEPYKFLIQITMFSGRHVETKRALYKSLVNNLHKELSISKNSIFIIIHEQPTENWGVKGGVPASDIDLGFNINV